MLEPQESRSPLHRAWNIFSSIAGVVGTAGMVDDFANWTSLIQTIVRGYAEIVHPILRPITQAIRCPSWFTDYLFIGLMVSSARARPTFNHMKVHWSFDVSNYKWYTFWAPHRVASFVVSVFMALLWPLVLLTFLPLRVLGIKKENAFQHQIWRDQYQWLTIYALTFAGLFIANAGLTALAVAGASWTSFQDIHKTF